MFAAFGPKYAVPPTPSRAIDAGASLDVGISAAGLGPGPDPGVAPIVGRGIPINPGSRASSSTSSTPTPASSSPSHSIADSSVGNNPNPGHSHSRRSTRLLGLSYLKRNLTKDRDTNHHHNHTSPALIVAATPRAQHSSHSPNPHALFESTNSNSSTNTDHGLSGAISDSFASTPLSYARTTTTTVVVAASSSLSARASPFVPASTSWSHWRLNPSSPGSTPPSLFSPSAEASRSPNTPLGPSPAQSPPTVTPLPAAEPPVTGYLGPRSGDTVVGTEPRRDNHADPMTRTRAATASEAAVLAQGGGPATESLPSIRFSTFYDPRATRPSLTFSPISRTLPTGTEVIRVGRYSERDAQPSVPANVPSAAPVGFKSKVVSRRHCEFWHEAGKWYIKDVKSSSGTFLNHIRLSPPGTESKPFPVNDGDIVQLGIDFKGGEEMIFRCVKMRLELNRGWQSKLNAFNMTTHKRLRNMTRSGDGGASGQTSQDCSICLNSIAPCQCLFVAPCSHTWHYKCIRSLLMSPQYPIFICPNCRAAADLEAEVEDPEEWEQMESDMEEGAGAAGPEASGAATSATGTNANPLASPPLPPAVTVDDPGDATLPAVPTPPLSLSQNEASSHATSTPVPIPRVPSTAPARLLGAQGGGSDMNLDGVPSRSGSEDRDTRTPSPTPHGPAVLNVAEGPITPRNDAGPWVFDGSGVRMRSGPPTTAAAGPGHNAAAQMTSLDDIARA